MTKAISLFVWLFMLQATLSYADTNKSYLLFETDRMLRYEYEATEDADTKAFTDYHIRMEPGTRLVFRVAANAGKTISQPPQKIYRADDTELYKPKFREMVNKNFMEMAILTAKGQGYVSHPVQEIILFEETGNAIEFKDRSLSFRYNFDYTYENGENLRFDANGYGILFFLNKGEEACLDRRTFRFHGEMSSDVYKNVTFLNKVGLWSITEGASKEGIFLKRVNAQTAEAFVKQICSTGEIFPKPQGSTKKPSIGEVLAEQKAQAKMDKAPDKDPVTKPFTAISEAPKEPVTNRAPTNSVAQQRDTTNPEQSAYFPKPKTVKPWEVSSTKPSSGGTGQTQAGKTDAPKPLPAGYHRVQSGETVSSIARQYNLAEDCLMEANNMTTEKLIIGQDILVAIGEDYQCPLPYKWVDDEENDRKILYHIVHRGEDLYQIAKNYRTTIEQIQTWNDLADPNNLQVRQELIVRIKANE